MATRPRRPPRPRPRTAPTPEQARRPLRTCIGCGRVRPAAELVRLARADDGALLIGRGHPGRGAWLCPETDACVDLAVRRRAIPRALRGPIDPAQIAALRTTLGHPTPIP